LPDPVERPAASNGSIWHRIREHKIIQWALGYLAAALALTHAEELVAHAFDWPDLVSRALIVVLALGLPIAITLAWYHGHRASQQVRGAEAPFIPILRLGGAGFLWLLGGPHQPSVAHGAAERPAATTTSPVSLTTAPAAESSVASSITRAST